MVGVMSPFVPVLKQLLSRLEAILKCCSNRLEDLGSYLWFMMHLVLKQICGVEGDSIQSTLFLFCLSGPLQPWSSESSIGSKQLESKPETDGSGTPQNNGGVRLHEFVSKTVGL